MLIVLNQPFLVSVLKLEIKYFYIFNCFLIVVNSFLHTCLKIQTHVIKLSYYGKFSRFSYCGLQRLGRYNQELRGGRVRTFALEPVTGPRYRGLKMKTNEESLVSKLKLSEIRGEMENKICPERQER